MKTSKSHDQSTTAGAKADTVPEECKVHLLAQKRQLEAEWKKYLHHLRHEMARQLHLGMGMFELLTNSGEIAQLGASESRQLAAMGRSLYKLQEVLGGMIDGAPDSQAGSIQKHSACTEKTADAG